MEGNCTLLWHLKGFCLKSVLLFFRIKPSCFNILWCFVIVIGSQKALHHHHQQNTCLGSETFKEHCSVTKHTLGQLNIFLWRINSPCSEQYNTLCFSHLIFQFTWETLSWKQGYCFLKAYVFLIFFSSLKTATYVIVLTCCAKVIISWIEGLSLQLCNW